MANDTKTTLTDRMAGFESFIIALDESTDLSDTAQLAIFVGHSSTGYICRTQLNWLYLFQVLIKSSLFLRNCLLYSRLKGQLQERTFLMKFKRYLKILPCHGQN
ncbi:unnamed protein product [Diatraea saccharalis]|uniref:DUF4371 domain-containing protein n=1 Tax=Diatraea saccharalis TaxID=40085 RepID=A0A9N9WCE4_9NEOP|nr:unnamed protein product [Diatraea saccharalis]